MNFILCILIIAYFCLFEINCRSVHLDSDVHSVFDIEEDRNVNHDPESSGKFSWKKLKPILRREVQRIRNSKGESNSFNQESISAPAEESENLSNENISKDKREDISLKSESQIINTSSVKSELSEHNLNNDPNNESNVLGELNSNATRTDIFQVDHPLIADDLSDNVTSDILNQSGDSLFLQDLKDNSNETDSFDFDEASLLSGGGHIATLQEVSTIGRELLIDSETKQNTILAELISQSNLITDDNSVSNSAKFQFTHNNESELQETTTNKETADYPAVTELNADEDELGNEFGLNEDGTANTEFGTDEREIENTESVTDGNENESTKAGTDEDETENVEFGTDTAEIENTESDADKVRTENTDFNPDEVKSVNNGLNFSHSVQDDSVTENRKVPKCPDPGWCIFWFLALDTCAKDSHCHGSLICCMIGCSKTCVDAEN